MLIFHAQPPPVVRTQTLETEVISASHLHHAFQRCSLFYLQSCSSTRINIVTREMIDMAPKDISLTLVNHSKENLLRELLQELYKSDMLEDLQGQRTGRRSPEGGCQCGRGSSQS